MTIEQPAPGEPRRPDGPRDPGDAWVVSDTGEKYWGRFGAAGLLAYDADRGVLLQHRVSWSHFGDTWGLPGGARHQGEGACEGALREAAEEAGVPGDAVRVRFDSVLDLQIWTYTTVVGDVVEPFEPVISDPESRELAWVPTDAVDDYPLHPGFASTWPELRRLLDVKPVIIVDAANVVGSVPDGWWKDRKAAAQRLIDRLARLETAGVAGAEAGLENVHWYPEIVIVVEGQAKPVDDHETVRVVRAPGEGDDEIVAEAARRHGDGQQVSVVTSDRGLTARLEELGVTVTPVSWLLSRLDTADAAAGVPLRRPERR